MADVEREAWLWNAEAPVGETDGGDLLQSASVVRGVSLSGLLQLLHLERKTCMLEVVAVGCFGTLTLVNGELVDASMADLEGEEAVYRILTWPHPQTTILEGVALFRHTVDLPISRLLMELVRREDEHGAPARSECPPAGDARKPLPLRAEPSGDWDRLVEALVVSGAVAAAVLSAQDGRVLALADEHRGAIEGLSAAALAELIPTTAGLRDWLAHASDADDVVARLNELHILIHPLLPDRTLQAFAMVESIGALDQLSAVCREALRHGATAPDH